MTASIITLLVAVTATVLPTVALDGKKIAVHIRQVSPVLLCALLVCVVLVTLAVGRMPSAKGRGGGEGSSSDASPDGLRDQLLGPGSDRDNDDAAADDALTRHGGIGSAGSINDDAASHSSIHPKRAAAAAEQARHFETPCSALRLTRFWLLWLGMVTICGSNVSTINLLSEIFTGRDAGSAVVSSLAPVFVMLSSAILRLSGGGIIRLALHRPVPLYLLVAAGATSLAAQLMLMTDSIPLLFVSCVLLGASDGMWWSALPIVSGRSKSALSNREPTREH